MEYMIRAMQAKDADEVLRMMRVFYASPAVQTNGSEEIFQRDIEFCLSDSPWLSGYVFEADAALLGYAMTAPGFSTEFGGPCLWIEDLYLKPSCRGLGLGQAFLRRLEQSHPEVVVFRLEVETGNAGALHLYQKYGYAPTPYLELKKQCPP